VEKILQPFKEKQVQELDLEKDSKLILLIDCWSIHMSKVFISWIKDFHPEILLIFVPTNCTSVFQPTDVILHSFMQQFDLHTSQDIEKQLAERDLEEVNLNTKMTVLKPFLCPWLHQA
jgi:hypothetical protein